MKTKLPLFSAYGVELEYMIVNKDDLSVVPISDKLIHDVSGTFQNEVEFEKIAWSNELVLHVIELKTNGPAKELKPLTHYFQHEVQKINGLLEKYHAKLLPTGAHPWMDPFKEAKLWPHDYNIIYETYHKIFDCRGHGWCNLQSVHLNLPFANDNEFAKLHTAIRLILPIIPALSASTPIIDGNLTGLLDTRLEFYRLNQQKIPSITGDVIPEVILSEQEYNDKILQKMYQEISCYDPDKVLQEEWLNSRGAIARFDRNTIEIRIIDTQECPEADLGIVSLIVAVLKKLVAEKWQPLAKQMDWSSSRLNSIFLNTIKNGMNSAIDNDYGHIFGMKPGECTARELWQHIFNQVSDEVDNAEILQAIIKQGNLAERITSSIKNNASPERIEQVYDHLARCLQTGKLFQPL
ncbi:MAG: glutamate--cysteine ligase [Gammaproteobacteria bacterium]|nr:glutamate--cysteine ligase [Gammaproteobacteria bacterium]